MDASDWIALAAAVIALAGLPFTVIGIRIARESKKISKEAAASAKKSADEAAAMTRIESERRAQEREDVHMRFKPRQPAGIAPELRTGNPTDGLFGSITVEHGYRVRAEAIRSDGSRTPLSLSVLHPNRPAEFHIEQWPPGQTEPVTKEIRISFWPPRAGDELELWACGCDRSSDESAGSPGHWEWRIPVVWQRPRRRVLGA